MGVREPACRIYVCVCVVCDATWDRVRLIAAYAFRLLVARPLGLAPVVMPLAAC
jgi:hypothetical protein